MKFLNVFCENRKANVYINLDKIVLVSAHEQASVIELEGSDPVRVNIDTEELVRKINGENKTAIGFRTTGN